jgi:hypothetical protein
LPRLQTSTALRASKCSSRVACLALAVAPPHAEREDYTAGDPLWKSSVIKVAELSCDSEKIDYAGRLYTLRHFPGFPP